MSNSTNLLLSICIGSILIVVGILVREPEIANVISTALITIGTLVVGHALIKGMFPSSRLFERSAEGADFGLPDFSDFKKRR